MLAMQPRARPQLLLPAAQPAAAAAAGGTKAGPEPPAPPSSPAATVLLLDVSLAAPLIVLPQSSASLTSLELDLGQLQLANAVAWRRGARAAVAAAPAAAAAGGGGLGGELAGPDAMGWQVLMDEMEVGVVAACRGVVKP